MTKDQSAGSSFMVALAVLIVAFLMLPFPPSADVSMSDFHPLKAGDSAVTFALRDLEGRVYDPAEHPDTVHLLFVWSIFCEPCKDHLPDIQKLYEKYADQGLEVLAISTDREDMHTSLEWLASQKMYTFRILLDELTEDEYFLVCDTYDAAGTPTVFIVNRGGRISYMNEGKIPLGLLQEAIEAALDVDHTSQEWIPLATGIANRKAERQQRRSERKPGYGVRPL